VQLGLRYRFEETYEGLLKGLANGTLGAIGTPPKEDFALSDPEKLNRAPGNTARSYTTYSTDRHRRTGCTRRSIR